MKAKQTTTRRSHNSSVVAQCVGGLFLLTLFSANAAEQAGTAKTINLLSDFPASSQLLVSDLDGDSRFEIVIAEQARVRVGDSQGKNWREYALSDAGSGIISADLNADGAAELLSKRFNGEVLAALEDGSYEIGVLTLTGRAPASARILVADDIDDDGFTDLLIGEADRSRWWGRDAESGEFRPLADLPALVDARCVDLDSDGGRDLLMQTTDGALALMARQKIGFDPQIRLLRENAKLQTVADLDNDGNQDLMLESEPGKPVQWLRNEGEFKFAERKSKLAEDLSNQVLIVDIDNDGYADILDQSTHHWFAGTDPRLGFESKPKELGLSAKEKLLGVADLDGDGWLELLVHSNNQLQARSLPPSRNGWLGVRLKPGNYNSGRAARLVALRRDGMELSDYVDRTQGLVGLGPLRQIDLLAVYWPSGAVSRIEVTETDRYFDIEEPPIPDLSIKRRKPGTVHRFYLDGARQCR